MALTLIYRPSLAIIDTVTLDASLSEMHHGENEITEHPVETGADITDHINPKSDTVTIEGLVSNTPITATQNTRAVSSQGQQLQTTTQQEQPAGKVGYAESAYRALLDIKDSGKIITIVTKLRTYTSMAMVSLDVPRNAQVGDVVRFTAVFKAIRTVQNQSFYTPVKTVIAQKKAKLGTKGTTVITPPAKDVSPLKDLFNNHSWAGTKPGSGNLFQNIQNLNLSSP